MADVGPSVATGTPAGAIVAGTVVDPPPRASDSTFSVQVRLVSEAGSAELLNVPLDESETVAELKQQMCGDNPDVRMRTNALYAGRLLADAVVIAQVVPSDGVIELIVPGGIPDVYAHRPAPPPPVPAEARPSKSAAMKDQIVAKSKVAKSKMTAAATGLWSGVKSTAAKVKASTKAAAVKGRAAMDDREGSGGDSKHGREGGDSASRSMPGLSLGQYLSGDNDSPSAGNSSALDDELDDLLTSSSSFQRERSARERAIKEDEKEEREEALRQAQGGKSGR